MSDEQQERRYHLASCEMYETLRGIFPNDRRLTGKSCSCGLKEFITADRKRVALEARISKKRLQRWKRKPNGQNNNQR